MTEPEPPELERFTHAEALALGRDLLDRCEQEALPVAIEITLGAQQVFHAALPGSSADNDRWAARKAATVRHFDQSSLAVYERYAKDDPGFLARFALAAELFAAAGGAVPIRVRGALVGVLAISGLDSESDHRLGVQAIRRAAEAQVAHPSTEGKGTR